MSKINKIKVNGTPYEVEDKEAVKTVTLTQAEYDALQTKDPSIFYVISDGQGGGGGMTSGEVQTMIDASISGKADTSAVTESIATAVSGKQDTLVSGTNIKTINNESILGSGNITISGGGSGSSAVEVTQAEYDALVSGGTLDPSVLYIITDAVGGDLSNYMTSAQTMNAISAATSTKQDILSAGTGIDITDNTISVTGGGITSGEVQDMIDESISGKVDTSAITSSVTSASTDSEVPTAKAVHDAISAGGGGGMTEDDELLLSTALTDLNDRKADKSLLSNYQIKGDYVTTSILNTRLSEYETALDEQNVEEVTAYALNDLNNRFGGLSLVKITESEYAALTTKDENTLYIVVADQS